MPRPFRPICVAFSVFVVCGALLLNGPRSNSQPAAADVLSATETLHWYRGNIHTHSLWSDGDDYLEMIALWYKQQNYDFLCFTDHNILSNKERWIDVERSAGKRKAFNKLMARFPNWVEQRTVDGRLEVRLRRFDEVRDKIGAPGKFLLMLGEEITDRYRNFPVHLNVSNIKEFIPPLGGESVFETMQNNVDAAISQSERTGQPMLVHMNHPNFYYAITAEELMRVRGENFFEVYNGHPSVHNSGNKTYASTERIWDIILTRRLAELGLPMMYGLATDDGHDYHNIPSRNSEPGRGWVMVLTDELTPTALINAMNKGRFYASSGVMLDKVVSSTKGLVVHVKPLPGVTYTIDFIGTRNDFDPTSKPVLDKNGKEIRATRRYSPDIGKVMKSITGTKATYEFTGDELYVRARITSSKKHPNPSELNEFKRAWTQPVKGPGAPKVD